MLTDSLSKQTDKLLKHPYVQSKKDNLALTEGVDMMNLAMTERMDMMEQRILDKIMSLQLDLDVEHGFSERHCSCADISSNSQSLDDEDSMARKRKQRTPNSRYHTIPKTVEDQFKAPEFQMLPRDISICALLDEYFISKPGSPSLLERDKAHGARWRYDQSGLWKYKKTFVNFVCKAAKEFTVEPQKIGQIIDEIAKKGQHRGLAALRTKIQDTVLQK